MSRERLILLAAHCLQAADLAPLASQRVAWRARAQALMNELKGMNNG